MTTADLDPRTRLEEQRQTLRTQHLEMVGQFSAGIAHDFNNLLTVILSNARSLEAMYDEPGFVPEEIRETIEAAEQGAEMVRRLIRFVRQEPVTVVPVSLDALAAELPRRLRGVFPPNIRIRVDCEGIPPFALADRGVVEEIVMNLALNARDAMPNGGTLRVTVHASLLKAGIDACGQAIEPGEYVTITVMDTGAGLEETAKRRMFEPFFTTKATGAGSGLGLAMTSALAQQVKAVIEVASAIGVGTSVKVSFPAMQVPSQR